MTDTTQRTAIQGTVFSLAFVGLCWLFRSFVLDDAYIVFRYAEHWAQGYGIVWNVGEDPVEGFTSMAWLALNAGATVLRLDPVIVSKLAALACALAIIWLLARAARQLPWTLASIFISAVGLSPGFALLTMQGLESALAALLLLLSAGWSFEIVDSDRAQPQVLWYVAALGGFLVRPDTAALNAGVFAGLVAVMIARAQRRKLTSLLVRALPFVAAFAAYMAWRKTYFGYWLPNTYYIKGAGDALFKAEGLRYALSFVILVLLPYLVLTALLMRRVARERVLAGLPTVCGCALFLAYLCTISPIQGHGWRFAYPMLPALLLVPIRCASDSGNGWPARLAQRRTVATAALIGFALWGLWRLPGTIGDAAERTQYDRVIAGRQLAGIPGTMLVSESGAVPYYSRWRAVDSLGLNSEGIAQHGLTADFLQDLNPDLVMTHVTASVPHELAPDDPVGNYLRRGGFSAVAAVRKSLDHSHVYYVRRSSPYSAEIARRLTHLPDVTYENLESVVPDVTLRGTAMN